MGTPSTYLTSETQAERQRLASLFGDLTPEQWDTPSLCDGWRVREVVAHMTTPFRTTSIGVMADLVRAGFSFNRYADRDARSAAEAMSEAEFLDLLGRNVDHPWRPPGGGEAGALSHDVIHGLDITEPLGLPRHRLNASPATDADVSVGEGSTAVTMTAREIVLVVTGRRPLYEDRGAK
jgi:uncharacterized protein (TIGR03083 family)